MRNAKAPITAAALALTLALTARAEARTVRDEPYPLDTTWNAAVRMVRVDFGFSIEERDHDLGYFTFQYREGRRLVPGSLELVRADVEGRQGTRIILQIPQMPGYVETVMLARLDRKLHAEFGEPPAAPRRPAPAPPPSGDRAPEGAPAQPPAPGSQPPATPAVPTVPVLTSGTWEGPARMRGIDD